VEQNVSMMLGASLAFDRAVHDRFPVTIQQPLQRQILRGTLRWTQLRNHMINNGLQPT
jgi:hypothetical protein